MAKVLIFFIFMFYRRFDFKNLKQTFSREKNEEKISSFGLSFPKGGSIFQSPHKIPKYC